MDKCNTGMDVVSIKAFLHEAKRGCLESRKKLIVENIGFAKSLSLRYRAKHIQNKDGLTAEALFGLVQGVDYLISHDDFDSPKGVIANFIRVALRDFIAHDRLFPVSRGTFKRLIESDKYPKQERVETSNSYAHKSGVNKTGIKDLVAKISEKEFDRRVEDFMADAGSQYKYILRMVLAGYKDYEIANSLCYSPRFIGMVREKEGLRLKNHLKKETHE